MESSIVQLANVPPPSTQPALVLDQQLKQESLTTTIEKIKFQAEQRIEEVLQYQAQLKEFANFICHEIRNPLNGVINVLSWIKTARKDISSLIENCNSDTKQKIANSIQLLKEAEDIIEECTRLQMTVVNDVLDLAKIEAGKVELRNANFNPKLLIANTMTIFSASFSNKNITHLLNTNSVDRLIMADIQRFRQILVNLLSNAIKFTHMGGCIEVSAHFSKNDSSKQSPANGYLQCQIKDNGIGMSKTELDKLFVPYQQANYKVSENYGGTGLGLNICKRLTQLMGGEIKVESEKGKGAIFTFTIGFQEPTLTSPSVDTKTIPLLTKSQENNTDIHILIVDDAITNQKVLSRMVRQFNYSSTIASNGQEALDVVKKKRYDMIFMDVTMPVMDGLTATRAIRQWEAELKIQKQDAIPIIGVSGNVSPEHRAEAIQAGMTEYLTKPYLIEDIRILLQRYSSQYKKEGAPVRMPETKIDSKDCNPKPIQTVNIVVHKKPKPLPATKNKSCWYNSCFSWMSTFFSSKQNIHFCSVKPKLKK